jgi:hypothetical protein
MSVSKAATQSATEERNKRIAIGVFAVVMLGLGWYEWNQFFPSAPAPVAAPAQVSTAPAVKPATAPGNTAGPAARTVGSTSAALDPTLHMQAMLVTESVTYTGTGRNIFAGPGDAREMPAIPKVIASARTNTPPPPRQVYTPPAPIGPPPIELKFFGMATSADGHRQAFLLHGDDVFLASKGDIVQRKYRVIDIGPNSIQVEDMSNNNRQTLPLQANP